MVSGYTRTVAIVFAAIMILSMVSVPLAAADAGPEYEGYAPAESSETSPANLTQPFPDELTLVYDAPTDDGISISIDEIYAGADDDALYVEIRYEGDVQATNDVNTAVFIDADQDAETGLNSETEDWYYMADIGADYAAIVGQEGPAFWEWNASAEVWGDAASLNEWTVDTDEDLARLQVDRDQIDDPNAIDFLVGNGGPSEEWAPPEGEGSLTFDLETEESDDADEEPPEDDDSEAPDDDILEGDVRVSVSPAERTVIAGSNVTYDIVLEGLDNGMSSYDVTVTTSNTDRATIADATVERESGFGDEVIAEDGSSVTLERALGDDTYEPTGEVVLGNVTVETVADANGSVNIGFNDTMINDLDSKSYNATLEGTTLELSDQPEAPDVTGDGQPATDTTGDGKLNDLDGSGEFGINDVQILFENRNSDTIQNNPEQFDFSGTGSVGIADIQALFEQLQAEG